jgi:phosphoribosylformimino-5-aminoimidazole carboxamide ribotide isomerase
MQIWPAIDLRGGKCVRLVQGDYRRELVFNDDPAAVARQLVEQGAECLHLVDLDGARAGQPINWDSIQAIVTAVSVPCELGGGIRDDATIERLLELGLARLVIGTRALRDPDWLRDCAARWPGRLVLGIDARDGQVATDGWLQTSSAGAEDLARQFDDQPLAAIIYTDIATDGMLGGPNLPAMRRMFEAIRLPLVASGGVTTVDDVAALAAIPVAGCIIGRALYENRISLPAALAAAGRG